MEKKRQNKKGKKITIRYICIYGEVIKICVELVQQMKIYNMIYCEK